MDFTEQEAECSDFSDSSSSNDEQDDDLEGFIDDQEHDDDEEIFANVVKPIDEDDPHLVCTTKTRWTVEKLTILNKISIELKNLGKVSSVSPQQSTRNTTYFFRPSYMEFIT